MASEPRSADTDVPSKYREVLQRIEELERQIAQLTDLRDMRLSEMIMPKFNPSIFESLNHNRLLLQVSGQDEGETEKISGSKTPEELLMRAIFEEPSKNTPPTVEITGEALASIVRIFELQQSLDSRPKRTIAQTLGSWIGGSGETDLAKSAPKDIEQLAVKTLQTALGAYRLLLEEINEGGEVVIRRQDRSTMKVNLR